MQTNFMILMNRSIVLAQILSNGIMKENFDYNYLGIEALMACYNECDYYVDQQNEYFWKNIGVVRDFLDDLMNAFAEAGVRLNSGTNYGECGKGFVRLNVATQTAVLKKGLDCIKVARDRHMA